MEQTCREATTDRLLNRELRWDFLALAEGLLAAIHQSIDDKKANAMAEIFQPAEILSGSPLVNPGPQNMTLSGYVTIKPCRTTTRTPGNQ